MVLANKRFSGSGVFPRRQSGKVESPCPTREHDSFLFRCSYIPVLCLGIFILDDGSDEYLHFHARQGLILFLLELAAGMLWFVPCAGPYICLPALAGLAGSGFWVAFTAQFNEFRRLPFLPD